MNEYNITTIETASYMYRETFNAVNKESLLCTCAVGGVSVSNPFVSRGLTPVGCWRLLRVASRASEGER